MSEHWISIWDTCPDDFREGDVIRWRDGDQTGTFTVGATTPARGNDDESTTTEERK